MKSTRLVASFALAASAWIATAHGEDKTGDYKAGSIHHGARSGTEIEMLKASTQDFGIRSDSPGKFGRMFPTLAPFIPAEQDLRDLAAALKDHAGQSEQNTAIPAIYTYLGQFVDHDITFDPTAPSSSVGVPATSFRSPEISLDSLYGSGPAVTPMFYERSSSSFLFALGKTDGNRDGLDLLRTTRGLAVLGDPRNDENLIVAQLHLVFQKAHNRIATRIAQNNPSVHSTFDLAKESLRWHYQWIVIHDFLRRVLDSDRPILDTTLVRGPRLFRPTTGAPFIPLEFSGAAYRFGHSLVRENYDHPRFPNATLKQLFEFTGNVRITTNAGLSDSWAIDNWQPFLIPNMASANPNVTRKIDPLLTPTLNSDVDLAARNLIRGRNLGLPKGQDVVNAINAAALGFTIPKLTPAQLQAGPDGAKAKEKGFDVSTPLWYYIMKESEQLNGGQRLGPTGSTIIAEVIVGLLLADKDSYLVNDPQWKPTLTLKDGTTKVDSLLKLIQFATE